VQTREGGEQGRVNVQDALGERVEKDVRHQTHESGERHQLDAVGVQHLDQTPVERLA